jgi:hypothetical protein
VSSNATDGFARLFSDRFAIHRAAETAAIRRGSSNDAACSGGPSKAAEHGVLPARAAHEG